MAQDGTLHDSPESADWYDECGALREAEETYHDNWEESEKTHYGKQIAA